MFLAATNALNTAANITAAIKAITIGVLVTVSYNTMFVKTGACVKGTPGFVIGSVSSRGNVGVPSFFNCVLYSLGFLVPMFVVSALMFFL